MNIFYLYQHFEAEQFGKLASFFLHLRIVMVTSSDIYLCNLLENHIQVSTNSTTRSALNVFFCCRLSTIVGSSAFSTFKIKLAEILRVCRDSN